ncbi:MAG: DUF72 domain-containing protein [Polyangiaceae bacterium]|nr:DUF72 domain-containing protein [Polyangiaceae bacterium]
MTALIKTGTAAWADRLLVTSGWYPPNVRSAEAKLKYYASQFPIVENDAGYWAVFTPQQVQLWAQRTPESFTMNMKAHALLTGHYTDPKRLPKDIRNELPKELLEKEHVYPRDLGAELMLEIRTRFHEALAPLHQAGKLGVVCFQFPVWFPISGVNKEKLVYIRRAFKPYRTAVEFRNATWMSEENRDETLEFLANADIVYTCVDEPQGFPSSVPPIVAATSDLAYVRMHGQNAMRWESGARSAAERFEYLYSREELSTWVPKIMKLAKETREVHVIMNNCYIDYAVRNAKDMTELLAQAQADLVLLPERRAA